MVSQSTQLIGQLDTKLSIGSGRSRRQEGDKKVPGGKSEEKVKERCYWIKREARSSRASSGCPNSYVGKEKIGKTDKAGAELGILGTAGETRAGIKQRGYTRDTLVYGEKPWINRK